MKKIYEKKYASIQTIFLNFSSITLLTIGFTFLLSVIELFLHQTINIFNIPISFLTSIILIYKFYGKEKLVVSGVLFIIVSLLFHFLLSKTYDVSWDGQWYHQDAIIKLLEGWNPFYDNYQAGVSLSNSDIWIHHYPQASWIVQANIFKLGGSIQASKMMHLMLSMASIGIAYFVFIDLLKLNSLVSLLFAVCIGLNPITYSQFFSFYVDGQSAMGLSIYVLLLIYLNIKPSFFFNLLIAAVFVYTANIKFTNIIYLSVFTLFYYAYLVYKKDYQLIKKATLYFISIYIIGIGFMGYSSYTRNTLEKGNPFYPLLGENNVGEIVKNIPLSANFKNQNRFENFVDASFAYPEYARDPDSSRFRTPFTNVSYDDFYRTDSELSGFGARWSEIIILCSLAFLILIFKLKKQKKISLLFIPLAVLVSVFINEQCFVARYVPQLWLVPVFILMVLYTQEGVIIKVFALGISVFLIYNTAKIVEAQLKYQKIVRNNINLEIDYLRTFKKPLEVKCKYKSVINRLKEKNISYIELNEESPNQKVQFNHTFEENYYIQQ